MTGFELLERQDIRFIVRYLCKELPQTTVLVLSHIDKRVASKVLSLLPEDYRSEIIVRMAELKSVSPKALEFLNNTISRQIPQLVSGKEETKDGMKIAVSLIRSIGSEARNKILSDIQSGSPELYEKIRKSIGGWKRIVGKLFSIFKRNGHSKE